MARNNRHQPHEEEESIFISMTDIMVGLLFIFILIIMFFALQAKLDAEKIENYQIEKEDLILELGSGGQERVERKELDRYLQRVAAQRTNILRWIESYLVSQGVESVELDIQNGILRLPEGVLFGSGRYNIENPSAAADAAKALAEGLSLVLPCSVMKDGGIPYREHEKCLRSKYNNRRAAFIEAIFLEGHTDNEPITRSLLGAPLLTSNLKLSARRATNTFEEIIDYVPGLMEFYAPISSGNKPVLAVSAYGATRPIASNDRSEGRASNRRIDLRILMHEPRDVDAHKRILREAGVPLKEEGL